MTEVAALARVSVASDERFKWEIKPSQCIGMKMQYTPKKVTQKWILPRRSSRLRPNIFGNQKNRAPNMANVEAMPITRWKCPVMKSSLVTAEPRSARARNKPDKPPERNNETKASAKSAAV